jgi:uncharacterized protein YndB with AHSA1/START domain
MSTTAPNDITPVVSVTEEIAAEPSTVFESLVDPAALAEWMRAPNDVGTHDWSVDLQPGGAWSVTVDEPDGTTRTLRTTPAPPEWSGIRLRRSQPTAKYGRASP